MSIPASSSGREGLDARTLQPVDVPSDPVEVEVDSTINELRSAELRYRALVEQIAAITYTEVDDPESATGTKTTFISPQSATILGYTPEELLSDETLWDRIIHPEDLERVLLHEKEVDDTGEPFLTEYRMHDRAGNIHWFRDEARLVEDEETGDHFWQGVMVDITEQKQALEQMRLAEERYRTLVETVPAVVFIDRIDEYATNIYTSPQSTVILGYTPEDWAADPALWKKIIHPDDIQWVSAIHGDPGRQYLFDEVYRMYAKDGRLVWVRDVAVSITGVDGQIYSHGFLLDVTAQKVAEHSLTEALEREHAIAQQLREMDELKNTLLHAISHDLKSPLTAILGVASTLSNPELDLTDDERRTFLRGLVDRAHRMDQMLTDLLDLERLDRGLIEPNRAPTDIAELCRIVVAHCDAVLIRPVVILAGGVIAEVDSAKVERIVENLLINAARHTPGNTRIIVRAERIEGGIEIAVDDEGPGVPDELKARIFQPFERGGELAERGPGMGIGLSLVARFAEMHGGRAWVEDRPAGGASFHVYLPG